MSGKGNTFRLSARARRAKRQPITYLMTQALMNPDVISLAAGLVDYDTLPGPDAACLLHELLSDPATAQVALQYGTTEGLRELRETLLEHLCALDGVRPDEINVTPDDVIITGGSQQLLFILSDILIDPGDIVVTAWPSYFVFTGTLESVGAEVRCVDMDEHGILPASLDGLLARLDAEGQLARVKMVYLVSYHQNPTGITLSADRRPEVVEIVRKYSRDHRILLLEDAAYRELTFEGTPPPSIKRFDRANDTVALLQTFSKPFAPGIRIGYGLLPRDLVEPVVVQKGNHDFGSANLCQHLALAAMRTGVYGRHVEDLCAAYAAKRNVMLASLEEHLGDVESLHWTRPAGGLYVYVTLAENVDAGAEGALFARALGEGMIYVPGEYCFGPDPSREIPRNTIRLSYGVGTIEQIRTGIERLARAIRSILSGQEKQPATKPAQA